MNNPRLSIGMPVFNGANFIRQAVRSLLAQDFEDFELIISDNGSTDETESICRELSKTDSRIRYHRMDVNQGGAWNFNHVFELSQGMYFKWAAHDDECHPGMLRRCVEMLDQAPDSVVMVYPVGELIDENGRTIRTGLDRIESRDPRPHRRLMHLLWSLDACDPVFGVFKREYLERTQLIGAFFGADYVLLAELTMLGEVWQLPEVLFRLRAHARRSMTANATYRSRAAWYDPAAAYKWFIMPDWERMVWESMKSALGSSLSPLEKWKCCMAIPATHYWRRYGGRMKNCCKATFGWQARDRRTQVAQWNLPTDKSMKVAGVPSHPSQGASGR